MSTQPRPRLISFTFSHFCEKARWALDRLGIDYEEELWPLGLHIKLSRQLGAPQSTVPILIDGESILQGSREILDWAEHHRPGPGPNPEDAAHTQEIRAIEARADSVIAVEVRRLLFSQTLTQHPNTILEMMYGDLDDRQKKVGYALWPRVLPAMIQTLDAGPEAAPAARAKLDAELDWLDATLADGRQHLIGDCFTRADLTVASLLSPFSRRAIEHMNRGISLPPEIERDIERMEKRPAMQWVAGIYRDFR
jgi:glutathione S-transferase